MTYLKVARFTSICGRINSSAPKRETKQTWRDRTEEEEEDTKTTKLVPVSLSLSQERRTRRMLELMSAPKQWEMGDGEVSEINTPWTNRARELQVNNTTVRRSCFKQYKHAPRTHNK